MVFQEEKDGKQGVLVYIRFETRKLDWMLILNSGISL